MKRKFLIGIIIGIMVFMTSCQFIEQAVEETFATQPQKLNAEEEMKDKNFLEKLKDVFLDESNERVFVLDIISDAEDKMGFEFSIELEAYFNKYIIENNIERYLSKEEIIEVAKEFDEINLLLNNEKLKEVMEELIEQLGTRDFYIYKARLRVHNRSLYIYVVDPENHKHVDLYYYNLGNETWHIQPEKLSGDVEPVEESVLLSEIPLENFEKVVNTGIEVLKDMGDYREFDIMNNELGITSVNTDLDDEGLIFKTTVEGTREDYNLIFDINGNLIKKERS